MKQCEECNRELTREEEKYCEECGRILCSDEMYSGIICQSCHDAIVEEKDNFLREID